MVRYDSVAEQTTYRASGVNVDEAERALRAVLPDILSTYQEPVVAGVGGFGALFRAGFPGMENPVLVSSIDGVGTKSKTAAMAGLFEGLGYDIVNHCVNDILCQGAKPLFFLDYFGACKLNVTIFEKVLKGAAEACKAVEMSLIGGETAEMPGVFHDDEFDVVGSIVGVVDYDKRLPRSKVRRGDVVIGIASDGLHTNGHALARRVLFEINGLSVRDSLPGIDRSLGEELLIPHRCYFNSVYPMLNQSNGNGPSSIGAIAHITGGGLYDNIPRILPSDASVVIDKRSWTPFPIFKHIQELGNISDGEMYRTFNMGVGMVLLVNRDDGKAVVEELQNRGERAALIGEITIGSKEVKIV